MCLLWFYYVFLTKPKVSGKNMCTLLKNNVAIAKIKYTFKFILIKLYQIQSKIYSL